MDEQDEAAIPAEEGRRRRSPRRRSGQREALRAKRKLQKQKRLAWIAVGIVVLGFVLFSGRFFE